AGVCASSSDTAVARQPAAASASVAVRRRGLITTPDRLRSNELSDWFGEAPMALLPDRLRLLQPSSRPHLDQQVGIHIRHDPDVEGAKNLLVIRGATSRSVRRQKLVGIQIAERHIVA